MRGPRSQAPGAQRGGGAGRAALGAALLARDARLGPSPAPAAEGALDASPPRPSPPPRRPAGCSGVCAAAAQPGGQGRTNRGGAAGGGAGGREGTDSGAEATRPTPRALPPAPPGAPGGRVGDWRTKRRPSPGATGGVTWPPSRAPPGWDRGGRARAGSSWARRPSGLELRGRWAGLCLASPGPHGKDPLELLREGTACFVSLQAAPVAGEAEPHPVAGGGGLF